MRARTLAILIPAAALAACNPPEPDDAAEARGNAVEAAPQPAAATNTQKASIMRPSVVNETAPAEPQPPEPIATTIPFGGGGAELSDEARAAIDQVLANPAFAELGEIVLRGHSDSKGTDRANLSVSAKRAEQVRDYLVERGVAEDRIRIIPLGEQRPVAPNANPDGSPFEEGRARNRRVEMEVLPMAAERVAQEP